jgi:hypothetical protein
VLVKSTFYSNVLFHSKSGGSWRKTTSQDDLYQGKYTDPTLPEISGYHGGEDIGRGLLGYIASIFRVKLKP